ncbi:MAG TPA: hypothetical protein VMY36_03795 [Patescibacteria group bacterium]|nr:hypothetical protein [Patescibacteria group bacterium]
MPASTDLVSRAFDLKVRYLVKPLPEYLADLESVLTKIKSIYPATYQLHFKRINIGAQQTADYLNEKIIREKKVKTVDYVGEINKGVNDIDLVINFISGKRFDVSLKFYKKKGRVNYWNPTLDSLLKHLTDKKFREYLDDRKLKKYLQEMANLKDISLASKKITPYWVAEAVNILTAFSQKNQKVFRNRLAEKLGYINLSLTCIVDENGVFKELIDVHPLLIEKLIKGKGKLKIKAHGIAIRIFLDDQLLTDLAVYAQSASGGRTGGLRIAAWTPHS